jgi:hypothetical protein
VNVHRDIERLEQLAERTRGAPTDDADTAALVNGWFDEHADRYVAELLDCPLGTHREQATLFERLDAERRVELLRRAIARCRSEQLSGLSAGGFMLGRFVCVGHPVDFWNQLDEHEVAFVLGEWVLHNRYLQLLGDVGERRLERAKQVILAGGLPEAWLTVGEIKVFVPLKLSRHDLARVADAAEDVRDDAEQIHRLLELLRQPYGALYDFGAPWSIGPLRALCEQAGIALPNADDV